MLICLSTMPERKPARVQMSEPENTVLYRSICSPVKYENPAMDQLPSEFRRCIRHERPPAGFAAECANAVALEAEYPGDVGVIGALLLNLVTLKPGEALALGAGNLHAYLEGTGVELMANSDNVLRGGLTPKHVDVPELLRVLDFTDGPVTIVSPRGAPEATYPTPFPDFRLSRVDVEAAVSLPRNGPDLLLCVEGEVTANGLVLARGQSAFAPFDDGALMLSGRGVVYRATVNT